MKLITCFVCFNTFCKQFWMWGRGDGGLGIQIDQTALIENII